jgi:hypothetical protein
LVEECKIVIVVEEAASQESNEVQYDEEEHFREVQQVRLRIVGILRKSEKQLESSQGE